MTKISIIGAGSMFTRHIVGDILQIPGLEDGVIALVDIDGSALVYSKELVEMVMTKLGKNWEVMPPPTGGKLLLVRILSSTN